MNLMAHKAENFASCTLPFWHGNIYRLHCCVLVTAQASWSLGTWLLLCARGTAPHSEQCELLSKVNLLKFSLLERLQVSIRKPPRVWSSQVLHLYCADSQCHTLFLCLIETLHQQEGFFSPSCQNYYGLPQTFQRPQ